MRLSLLAAMSSVSATRVGPRMSTASSLADDCANLAAFIRGSSNLVAITGAGISTASSIPDYRGLNGSYSLGHKPMLHQDFVGKESSRKRYWARSLVGFRAFEQAKPNLAHYALAQLELQGLLKAGVVTQNVDRLHYKAGSQNVVELHGRNDRLECMSCSATYNRKVVHQQLEGINAAFMEKQRRSDDSDLRKILRPDGDADVASEESFQLVGCQRCGGTLKPQVVFFGDNVRPEVKRAAEAAIAGADHILIVGTSLEVFSIWRFISASASNNIPLAIVNQGPTRADRSALSNIKFRSELDCSVLLPATVKLLLSTPSE